MEQMKGEIGISFGWIEVRNTANIQAKPIKLITTALVICRQ